MASKTCRFEVRSWNSGIEGESQVLKAGFARVCISPLPGAPLAGFAARQHVSEGIHDDLFARALVITNDEGALALVSLDVLALPD